MVVGQVAGESVARSLFQSATGLFRKRAVPVTTQEPAVRRREPMTEPAQMATSGELVMEAERPVERRSMAVDDGGLDIPAFLRRQSS